MVILPAIDLLDGQVVRLTQGRRDQVTVYSKDPTAMARRWVEAGATWLHVVDLNGAFDGAYTNLSFARRIIETCGIQVELSGGIRTAATLTQAVETGAARVILGTKACEDLDFVGAAVARYKEKIAVAIDAKAGQVVARGWVTATPITPANLARNVRNLGVRTVVCTDVSRDGMLTGVSTGLLQAVLDIGGLQAIASGGIASLEDLQRLKALEPQGVIGAIVGKALYEGAIDLQAALAALG